METASPSSILTDILTATMQSQTLSPTIETTTAVFDEFSTAIGIEASTLDTNLSSVMPNVSTPLEDPYLVSLKYSHTMLVRYGPMTVIALGVVGNSLSLVVLCRQQYSRASTTWYMKVLAIFDLINSIAWPLQRWLTTHYPHIAIAMGDVFCIEYFFGGNWMVTTSAWILVFMTIDRTISVTQPLKASQICTVKRARKIVIILTVLGALFASPSFTRRMKIQEGAINRAQCPFNPPWLYEVFYYAVVVVRLWAAPIVVLICNIIIITMLMRRRQERQQMAQSAKSNKEAHLNVMLMLVSWVFIICYFPNAIDILVWNVGIPEPRTPVQQQIRKISFEVIAMMMYLNHAANFYLYVMGVKKFRDDFVNTFRCRYQASDAVSNGTKSTGLSSSNNLAA